MTSQLTEDTAEADPARSADGIDTGLRRVGVLVAASVASFIVALDLLVVTTVLGTIRQDLGTSPPPCSGP